MIKLNIADQEIFDILKDVFQLKRINPIKSDESFRLWVIRSFFVVSLISFGFKIYFMLFDKVTYSENLEFLNTPIAIFFTVLFLHINNKSKNSSVILFLLTWLSLMLTLYI